MLKKVTTHTMTCILNLAKNEAWMSASQASWRIQEKMESCINCPWVRECRTFGFSYRNAWKEGVKEIVHERETLKSRTVSEKESEILRQWNACYFIIIDKEEGSVMIFTTLFFLLFCQTDSFEDWKGYSFERDVRLFSLKVKASQTNKNASHSVIDCFVDSKGFSSSCFHFSDQSRNEN